MLARLVIISTVTSVIYNIIQIIQTCTCSAMYMHACTSEVNVCVSLNYTDILCM